MTIATIWRRIAVTIAVLAGLSLLAAGAALAHARVLPAESLAGGQLYALSVPNEKEDATTTKVVLTVPDGFSIGLFEDSPGWTRDVQTTGAGEDERVDKVTWTSEADGTSEGALFQFTGRTDPGSYTFTVAQSYSDGSVVNWAGSEDSDEPAPVVDAKDSFSSGGNSTLSIIALVVGAIGVLLGAVALLSARGRSLA